MKKMLIILAVVVLSSCEKEGTGKMCDCTTRTERRYINENNFTLVSSSPMSLQKPRGGKCSDNNSITVGGLVNNYLYRTVIECK